MDIICRQAVCKITYCQRHRENRPVPAWSGTNMLPGLRKNGHIPYHRKGNPQPPERCGYGSRKPAIPVPARHLVPGGPGQNRNAPRCARNATENHCRPTRSRAARCRAGVAEARIHPDSSLPGVLPCQSVTIPPAPVTTGTSAA